MNAIREDLLIECLAQMALNYLEEQHDGPATVEPRTGPSDDGQLPTGRSSSDYNLKSLRTPVGGGK